MMPAVHGLGKANQPAGCRGKPLANGREWSGPHSGHGQRQQHDPQQNGHRIDRLCPVHARNAQPNIQGQLQCRCSGSLMVPALWNELQTKLFLGARLDGQSSVSQINVMAPMGLALADLLMLCDQIDFRYGDKHLQVLYQQP